MSQMSNVILERIKQKISVCTDLTVLLKCFYFGDSEVRYYVQKRFDYIAQELDSFRDSKTIKKKLKSSLV